jgi:hypothetical protein
VDLRVSLDAVEEEEEEEEENTSSMPGIEPQHIII